MKWRPAEHGPSAVLSGVYEITWKPNRTISWSFHYFYASLTIWSLYIALTTNCYSFRIGRFVGPTPLTSVIFIHPIWRIRSLRHFWIPFQWQKDVRLDHGKKVCLYVRVISTVSRTWHQSLRVMNSETVAAGELRRFLFLVCRCDSATHTKYLMKIFFKSQIREIGTQRTHILRINFNKLAFKWLRHYANLRGLHQ